MKIFVSIIGLAFLFSFFIVFAEEPTSEPDYERSYRFTNELVQERRKLQLEEDKQRFIRSQLDRARRAKEVGLEELELEFLGLATEAGWNGFYPPYPASANTSEKIVQLAQPQQPSSQPLPLSPPGPSHGHRALWLTAGTGVIIGATAIVLTLLRRGNKEVAPPPCPEPPKKEQRTEITIEISW